MNLHLIEDKIKHVPNKKVFKKFNNKMTLTEFMKIKPKKFGPVLMPRERIVCEDNFSISVQASPFTYSSIQDKDGLFETVELGFPSTTMPKIFDIYRLNEDENIYIYVPFDLINNLVMIHGNIIGCEWYESNKKQV